MAFSLEKVDKNRKRAKLTEDSDYTSAEVTQARNYREVCDTHDQSQCHRQAEHARQLQCCKDEREK